ncbi:PQQ-binding-like beta-propeller repeat protein [Candidatus Woesearchaeota archaeon]|nr:PQQ-binding-like beta-propeller repeat protein [Candidatus Woesearchaeota archaeon]
MQGLALLKRHESLKSSWVLDTGSRLLSGLEVLYSGRGFMLIQATADGRVLAIDGSGKELWSFREDSKIGVVESFFYDESKVKAKGAPSIGDINGDSRQEIVFGAESGLVTALDDKGRRLWRFNSGAPVSRISLGDINSDGNMEVLFGSSGNAFYALNSLGKPVWRFMAESGIESGCCIAGKGDGIQIVFGSNDGTVYSLDRKGKLLWRFKADGKVLASPVEFIAGKNSAILVGSDDNHLYALNFDGSLMWKFDSGGSIVAEPVVADINGDGSMEIIFGSCDNNLYVISENGGELWRFETNFWITTPPVLADVNGDNSDEILLASLDNFLYVLKAEPYYELKYVPGLSSVIPLAGNYTDVPSESPGAFKGSKVLDYNAGGMIIGLKAVHKDGWHILLSLDNGKICRLDLG